MLARHGTTARPVNIGKPEEHGGMRGLWLLLLSCRLLATGYWSPGLPPAFEQPSLTSALSATKLQAPSTMTLLPRGPERAVYKHRGTDAEKASTSKHELELQLSSQHRPCRTAPRRKCVQWNKVRSEELSHKTSAFTLARIVRSRPNAGVVTGCWNAPCS